MLLGLLTTLFRSLDKIFIAKVLGFEALGWYSTALMATAYISNFPISIAIVLLPHFQELYGKSDDPRRMRNYLFKSSVGMALVMPFLIGAVWVFAPYAISVFLPKFTPGIPAMKILALSMFFIAVGQLFYDALVNIKKHLILFPIFIFLCVLTGCLDWIAVHSIKQIEGVALATTLGASAYFIIFFWTASHFFSDFKTSLKTFGLLTGLSLYLILFYFMLERSNLGTFSNLQAFLIHCLVYLTFCSPLVWILNREFSLLPALKTKLGIRSTSPK